MYDPARDSFTTIDESSSHDGVRSSPKSENQIHSQAPALDSVVVDAKVEQGLDASNVANVTHPSPLPAPDVEQSDEMVLKGATRAKSPPSNPATSSPHNLTVPQSDPLSPNAMEVPKEEIISSPKSRSDIGEREPQAPDAEKPKTEPAASSAKQDTHAADQDPGSRLKRKRVQEHSQKNRKRGKPALSAYSRRDEFPPQPRQKSPSPIRRSPSPDSPVRQRKRPGGGARINSANLEAIKRRQEERERQREAEAQKESRGRGVHDVVRQHYNAVPQRGREWRKTDSKIKGLRSFNNWIKSTVIQRFSPDEDFLTKNKGNSWSGEAPGGPEEQEKLLVLDVGCGKGGDLGKWLQAPQPIDLYVGLDPAEISIDQARERYNVMKNDRRRRRGHLFHAEFHPKDCFGEPLADLPIIQRVGIDTNIGPNGSLMSSRWGGGGFDIVASMFTMHYAFESEEKARQMLQNVAGALKKGGRFLGVGPNSDAIGAKVAEFHKKRKEKLASTASENNAEGNSEDGAAKGLEWGNSIYRVRFPGDTPEDGVFRPAFGWKYSYFMEEAVEEIPEYVVPWEAFRALTQDYNLELQYRKPFLDVWKEEKDDSILGPLSERMGVRSRDGELLVNEEELEAASLYHAFCFYKV